MSSSVLNAAGKPFVEQFHPEIQKLLEDGYRISAIIPQSSSSAAIVFITYVLDDQMGELTSIKIASTT